MVNQLYEETISEIIMERTSCGDGWKPMHKSLRDESTETFPQAQPMAGSVLFMGWDHKHRDEMVILGAVAGEDEPWGIDIQTNGGAYHLHGARTLESACETASVCMYMLNHFANEHRNTDNKQTEDEEVSDKLKNARTRIKELEEACEAHKQRADEYQRKYQTIISQLNTMVDSDLSAYEDGNWHGMIEQPQRWRPPTTDEVVRLKDHIKMHWDAVQKEPQSVPEDRAKRLVSEAFIIVLDDFYSVVTGVEDKMMFALFKSDGSYCTYLFNENSHRLKEVAQNSNVISSDPDGEVVVSFGSGD